MKARSDLQLKIQALEIQYSEMEPNQLQPTIQFDLEDLQSLIDSTLLTMGYAFTHEDVDAYSRCDVLLKKIQHHYDCLKYKDSINGVDLLKRILNIENNNHSNKTLLKFLLKGVVLDPNYMHYTPWGYSNQTSVEDRALEFISTVDTLNKRIKEIRYDIYPTGTTDKPFRDWFKIYEEEE